MGTRRHRTGLEEVFQEILRCSGQGLWMLVGLLFGMMLGEEREGWVEGRGRGGEGCL